MNKIIADKINILTELCRRYDIKKMYLFGSACSDKFSDESNIDILITFKDIPIEKYTDNYF